MFFFIYVIYFFRYKNDPWLWDLEWDVQEFKQKKITAGKKKNSKKVVETQAVTALPEQEEGTNQAAAATEIRCEKILRKDLCLLLYC